MNSDLVRDIYEGYLTYMYVYDDMPYSKQNILHELYAEMRNIIQDNDINTDETLAQIMTLKNKADAIVANINAISNNNNPMTLDELNVESNAFDAPSIKYCEKTYSCEYWNYDIYALIRLKIMMDEEYKNAFLEKENLAELEATRRETDSYIKLSISHSMIDLYTAMYCCAKCKNTLSDTELDEKAIDMHYGENETKSGYCCVCANCHAEDEQILLESMEPTLVGRI